MDGNLLRTSDLLLIDAVSRRTKRYFDVLDIVLNRHGNVCGIIVCGKGIMSLKKYVSAKNIDKISRKQILIKDTEKFIPKKIKEIDYCTEKLLGKPILSQDGAYLGTLSDIYVNTEKMRVMAVELGRSFFEDLFTGRVLIPGNIIDCTKAGIIISELQIENSLHNTKGIINAIDEGLKNEKS